jgi:Spy/CpxP family protein refolding chaperone
MKKGFMLMAVIGIVALSAAAVFARGGYGMFGNGPGSGGYSYMQQELNLTDQQQDQIFKISQEYRQKFYDNRKDSGKFEALRTERLKAIEGVLNAEQKEKFAKIQKDRDSRRRGPWGRGDRW